MRNPGKTLGSRQKALGGKLPRLKQVGKHDSRIVSTEQEILEFSKLGYSCTPLGNDKWLMIKKYW